MTRGVLAFLFLAALSPLWITRANAQGQSAEAPKQAVKAASPVDYTLPGNRSLYIQRSQTEIPSGDGAWVIELETTGGYVPIHRSITLTSRGRVTIEDSGGTCSYDVEGGFPEIDRLIRAANEAGWGEPVLQSKPTSACYDCRFNRLTLNGRATAGATYGHSTYWNDFTFGKLKKEVAAICRAIEKIERECPQTKG